MINLFLSMVQMYLESNSKSSTDFSRDFISQFKDRGKDFALAFVMLFLAALFVFAGLVLFILEIGLQVDKEMFFSFSGLIISSCILLTIAFFFFLLSLNIIKEPKEKTKPNSDDKPVDELKKEIYDLALMFLREFKENHKKQKAKE